jgi:hypothetical protein
MRTLRFFFIALALIAIELPVSICFLNAQKNDRLVAAQDSIKPTNKKLRQKEPKYPCHIIEIIPVSDARAPYDRAYVTECGLTFFSRYDLQLGDTLWNLGSPKHY